MASFGTRSCPPIITATSDHSSDYGWIPCESSFYLVISSQDQHTTDVDDDVRGQVPTHPIFLTPQRRENEVKVKQDDGQGADTKFPEERNVEAGTRRLANSYPV